MICGGAYSRQAQSKGRCPDCERAKLLRDGIVAELRVIAAAIEALTVKVTWGAAVPPPEGP